MIIGVEAQNHFQQSFQDEGFTDTSLKKWDTRKVKRDGAAGSRPVLSGDTGDLADSIKYSVSGMTVYIESDKPYAQIHNEGGKITITDKMRRFFWAMFKETGDKSWKWLALTKKTEFVVPQRMFIGHSQILIDKINQMIQGELDNILFK